VTCGFEALTGVPGAFAGGGPGLGGTMEILTLPSPPTRDARPPMPFTSLTSLPRSRTRASRAADGTHWRGCSPSGSRR
jgi:hypothetical protein